MLIILLLMLLLIKTKRIFFLFKREMFNQILCY